MTSDIGVFRAAWGKSGGTLRRSEAAICNLTRRLRRPEPALDLAPDERAAGSLSGVRFRLVRLVRRTLKLVIRLLGVRRFLRRWMSLSPPLSPKESHAEVAV